MFVTIKTEQEINKMRVAGKILSDTFKMLESHIFPGQTSLRLNDLAYKFITSKGGYPTCLNYEGFPYSICASVNDQVVHGFCTDIPLKDGDIISLDFVVNYQGYNADAARTYLVGNVKPEVVKLVEDTKQAFFEGIKDIKAGSRLGHISHRIQVYLEERGYGVVREMAGHGIGKEMHEDPCIPNFGKYNSGLVLSAGMTFAVEPMVTLGKRDVYLEDNDWTVTTQDGKPSAHYENTILITDEGLEILTI